MSEEQSIPRLSGRGVEFYDYQLREVNDLIKILQCVCTGNIDRLILINVARKKDGKTVDSLVFTFIMLTLVSSVLVTFLAKLAWGLACTLAVAMQVVMLERMFTAKGVLVRNLVSIEFLLPFLCLIEAQADSTLLDVMALNPPLWADVRYLAILPVAWTLVLGSWGLACLLAVVLSVVMVADRAVDTVAATRALFDAAEVGDAEKIGRLLEAGASVNDCALCSMTPLHLAAANGHMKAVNALLKGGARIDARTADGLNRTPLHKAALKGHAEVFSALVRQGADAGAKDGCGKTPAELQANSSRSSTSFFRRFF